MFTGLVEETGTVRSVDPSGRGARLTVEAALAAELRRGDSVAVDGVCLTAVEVGGASFAADVMVETLERSALGSVERGDRVNLELPLRAGDRLGGHIVHGHVDGVGTVESVEDEGSSRRLRVRAGERVCRYLVARGSVAVDGISLTVTDAGRETFSVALIPETLERTTLGTVRPGDPVNLEVDVLAKYVESIVRARAPRDVLAGEARG